MKIKSIGKVIKIGDIFVYLPDGEHCPPYAQMTEDKAWCDEDNVVHKGIPDHLNEKEK